MIKDLGHQYTASNYKENSKTPKSICWVRIDQRVGYGLTESGYETSKPGYESSGYETSMGTKRLISNLEPQQQLSPFPGKGDIISFKRKMGKN